MTLVKFPIPKFWLSIETCEVIYKAFKDKAASFTLNAPMPSFEARYKGNLESIIYGVQLKGDLLQKDIVYVATAYFVSISKSQAFFDANKRMAIILTNVFLERNGYHLNIANKSLIEISIILSISDHMSIDKSIDIILSVFEKHVVINN